MNYCSLTSSYPKSTNKFWLLYEIISKRSVEVHNVRATNAPDLASFVIDMEFNVTSISSMTCSNLRHLPTFVTGNPGFVDYTLASLSHFANYSCSNTSKGPTITLSCMNCVVTHDNMYISWHFLDIPNVPASAVGFEFNVTTRSRANTKHVSLVSGVLKNDYGYGYGDGTPVTFRGVDANILKFSLFPRTYKNLHDLRLVQPLFHDFLPGSSPRETSQLRTSLEYPRDGVINTTLHIEFLSAYIIEIENQNIMGPVSFLADVGGLYSISIAIFFSCLVQCEYRVKSLRNEDSIMQQIRNRRKAQQRWSKLRRYVMYTWGCIILDHNRSVRGNGSSHKRRQQSRLPGVKNTIPENNHHTLEVKPCIATTAPNCELLQPSKSYRSSLYSDIIPQQPSLELKDGSQMDTSVIEKNLQSLYQYNVMLRDNLVAAQSLLDDLATKSKSQG